MCRSGTIRKRHLPPHLLPAPLPTGDAPRSLPEAERAFLLSVLERNRWNRAATARELGIDHVVNLQKEDPIEKCRARTGGRGADLVGECSGAPPAIASTPQYIRKLGRICAVGLTGKRPVEFDWDAAEAKVCTIIFNMSTFYTSWDRAISMIASAKINAKAITTHILPLERWQEGFDAIETMAALKVVLIPS